jgi:hypothetical protein
MAKLRCLPCIICSMKRRPGASRSRYKLFLVGNLSRFIAAGFTAIWCWREYGIFAYESFFFTAHYLYCDLQSVG